MKKIEAYIKSSKVNEVIEELHALDGLTGVSVIHHVAGYGRQKHKGENSPHIVDNTSKSIPHSKLEIFCKDDLCSKIIDTIQKTAHTGLRSDGKIFILPLEDAVRISKNQRGENVV